MQRVSGCSRFRPAQAPFHHPPKKLLLSTLIWYSRLLKKKKTSKHHVPELCSCCTLITIHPIFHTCCDFFFFFLIRISISISFNFSLSKFFHRTYLSHRPLSSNPPSLIGFSLSPNPFSLIELSFSLLKLSLSSRSQFCISLIFTFFSSNFRYTGY